MSDEFDKIETIAGFPLVAIKRALTLVGIGDDRDDLLQVAQGLNCHPSQAADVLEVLEREGFVTKTSKRKQWDTTALARRLVFYWHPARKCEPVIYREDERGVYGEVFDSVPCSILRCASEDDQVFEHAEIETGVMVEYESERVIEVSVSQPDDYDRPDGGGLIELSVYLSISEAKAFADAFKKAIAKAEKEMARRAAKMVRQAQRKPAGASKGDVATGPQPGSKVTTFMSKRKWNVSPSARPSTESHPGTVSQGSSEPLAAKAAGSEGHGSGVTLVQHATTRREEAVAKKRREDTLAATVAELRAKNRVRRAAGPDGASTPSPGTLPTKQDKG